MPGNQLVFTGVPAFVGVVKGRTTVQFFTEEQNFDPRRMIEVDLAKNPKQVAPASWATDVDCDYQTEGGLTTIGPEFHRGHHVGAVYLAERLYSKYSQVLASWPPEPDDLYQYQLVMRADAGNITRYHGFKVRVIGTAVGSLIPVAFIRAGSPASSAGRVRWVDLADSTFCDPKSSGFTTIGTSSPPGTVGALFLTMEAIADGGGHDVPKIPRAYGW